MSLNVAALYQFVSVADPQAVRAALLELGAGLGLKGTLILAQEGINGTIAGTDADIETFLQALREGVAGGPAFGGLELKFSTAPSMPFQRWKVRVKREIVTLGAPAVDPTKIVGTYVAPSDWNALLDTPGLVLVDTRNAFEVERGSFPGAVDPGTKSFGAFPAFVDASLDPAVHRKVAMFCTGGIRCEKASSLLRARGFEEVYHLKGGILAYLEQVPAAESRWQGDCFVFDERVALGVGLVPAEQAGDDDLNESG